MCAIPKGLSIHMLSQNTNYVSKREAKLPQVKSDDVWIRRWAIPILQPRSNTLSYNPDNYSFLENRVGEGRIFINSCIST